jgi:ribosomal protein L7Ae-like RNA K-turn-binding protein
MKPLKVNWREKVTDKSYSFIGLARKAGKLVYGEMSCGKIIKNKKASLVIIACDASENTRKKFENSCNYKKIPFLYFGEKEVFGKLLGKDVISVIAITDTGFAQSLTGKIRVRQNNKKKHGGGLIE